jgi:predicted amidohydrolase
MTRIAVLQMTSGIDPGANFDTIRDAAYEAGQAGAKMLFTPEMSLLLDRDRQRASEHVCEKSTNRFVGMLQNVAEENGIEIALGSMAVPRADGRWANRSMLFPPSGEQPYTYDKLHMFDVDLAGESWRESSAYAPGDALAVADTAVGKLGLTICYDIRFPALFEALSREKCDVIAIPAAFTVPTGKAHWHVLQRARAIEATAYVVAAAQVGEHADGRKTYGHSVVVDPWGEVLLDMGGAAPGLAFAEIDPARIVAVRAQVPSLANRREVPNLPA